MVLGRYRPGWGIPAGWGAAGILVSALLLFGSPLAGRQLAGALRGAPGPASSPALARDYARLPQSFEPNRGQTDPRVDFLSHGRGYSLFLSRGNATLVLSRHGNPRAATALRMRLAGARAGVKATGAGSLPGTVNYFRGHDSSAARTAIPTYRGVVYRGVYAGVDLRYYGSQRRLEYDFSLAPNVDPSTIALDFSGARGVSLAAGGRLELRLPGGVLRENAPVAYQVIAGARRPVAARYVVRGDRVSFALGAYDHSRPLTIDPIVLAYSTYLGGGARDSGQGIAVASAGSAYLTGWTESTDFPTTGLDTTQGGDADVFVTKLAPDGKSLAYSTYIGGDNQDIGQAIAVDSTGAAYVTGRSLGTNGSHFPTTPGAYDSTVGGIADAFVAKLAPDGQSLAYSTYLGGTGQENGEAIAVDSSGAAYVTGFVDPGDFPTTLGAFQTASGGGRDDFVTKLAPDGKTLDYSTYLGGSADEGEHDQHNGVAVDSTGAAYVTGQTSSTDFPMKNALDSTLSGPQDAYVTKFAPDGKTLDYSTYLGGGTYETGAGLAVDSAGSAYVTGLTTSTDFPAASAFDTTLSGASDAFVSKLAPDGTSLAYSTYLGGGADENGSGVAVDSAGSAYVTGDTSSGDFPTSADASDTTLGGSGDAFVSKLAADGKSLAYSTYLGGSANEFGAGVAVDSGGAIYVTGTTFSADFPTAGGAFDTTLGGSQDAFASKIANVSGGGGGFVPPPVDIPPVAVSFTKITSGPDGFTSQAPTYTFTSTVAGATFECQFDGEPFQPCTTPLTRYGLPLGPHSFTVRAVTPAGDPDPQPDARVFTLGVTTTHGSCTITPQVPGSRRCVVLHAVCPAGSVCTLQGTSNMTTADLNDPEDTFVYVSFAGAGQVLDPHGVPEVSPNFDQAGCSLVKGETANDDCPQHTRSLQHLGADDSADATCQGNVENAGGSVVSGPDDQRQSSCQATFTVRPARGFEVIAQGGLVVVLAPAPGVLNLSAAGPKKARIVAAARKRPRSKPPVAPVRVTVKRAGPVRIKLKLSKATARKLSRHIVVSLRLSVVFRPRGGQRRATIVRMTLRRPPPCPRPWRGHPRVCQHRR